MHVAGSSRLQRQRSPTLVEIESPQVCPDTSNDKSEQPTLR
ncbi:hypothetical protein V6Z11_A10G243600 [Gossypium hirsutum]